MARSLALALALGCVGAGLATGLALGGRTSAPGKAAGADRATPPAQESRARARTAKEPSAQGVLISAPVLRQAIREEVSEALAADRERTVEPEAPPPEGESAPLEGSVLAAHDRSVELVSTRIASGVWSEADRDSLTATMADLPGEVRVEILRPLVAAVNSAKVRFEGNGSLF